MTPTSKLSLGLLLTLAAGYTDAIGFVELGGYFTSFMSGNTTQLGIELTSGIFTNIALLAGLILCFFIGGLTGSLLALWQNPYARAAVAGLAATFTLGTLIAHYMGVPTAQSMLFLAAAAGAQNAILRPIGGARLGATFVTGTLFSASQELAKTFMSRTANIVWLQHLLVWLALLLGALIGAAVHSKIGVTSLIVPLTIYIALSFNALRTRTA